MWTHVLAWLRKPPNEAPVQEQVERLMSGLGSQEPAARRRADLVLARILGDDAGYDAHLRLELLKALAEHDHPDHLDFVPRYVHLLANTGFSFGRPSPLQLAAKACLNCWEVREKEHEQADTLVRGAEAPVNSDTLLRPAAGTLPTEADQLLRASTLNETD